VRAQVARKYIFAELRADLLEGVEIEGRDYLKQAKRKL
jgi:hypothetical protein